MKKGGEIFKNLLLTGRSYFEHGVSPELIERAKVVIRGNESLINMYLEGGWCFIESSTKKCGT